VARYLKPGQDSREIKPLGLDSNLKVAEWIRDKPWSWADAQVSGGLEAKSDGLALKGGGFLEEVVGAAGAPH
jgi:hypothetical protein